MNTINLQYSDLKIGTMFVPAHDCFMLGTRYVVEEINERGVICAIYSCGKRQEIGALLQESDEITYYSRVGETLEEWKNKKFNTPY